MSNLAAAAREQATALARLADMLVELADQARATDDERAELADLLVTLGIHEDVPALDELDPGAREANPAEDPEDEDLEDEDLDDEDPEDEDPEDG